jgi:predicted nucleic acid-binding protein
VTSASSGKNGLVVADAGAIFSLAVLDQLELLNALFDDIAIPSAVWKEITLDNTVSFYYVLKKRLLICRHY